MIAEKQFTICDLALVFATAAHGGIGQVRKHDGDPYIKHPMRVAEMVVEYCPEDLNLIAATLLHDVVEDTKISSDWIRTIFGHDIADLVDQVTNTATEEDGNRDVRNAINLKHIIEYASPRAQTLKLADIFDNVSDYISQNPGYAVKYISEKLLVLPHLKQGDAGLFVRVETLLNTPVPFPQLAQAA